MVDPQSREPMLPCEIGEIWAGGANVAECAPITTSYIWEARERGARIINVDPRITPLARTADLVLPVKPGRDAALFAGARAFWSMVEADTQPAIDHSPECRDWLNRKTVAAVALEYADHAAAVDELATAYADARAATKALDLAKNRIRDVLATAGANRIKTDDGPILIGHPIANTTLHVLDADQQPVPIGVIGELFIGGDGVTLGYLSNLPMGGSASVKKILRTYTITGQATGINISNPLQPARKNFEFKVRCP